MACRGIWQAIYGDLFLTHEPLTISVRNPSFSTNAVNISVLCTIINRVVQKDMSKQPDNEYSLRIKL